MERIQEDGQHEYRVTPVEYPISANEAHSTYDQFIQLRDTLIYSNKYYGDNAGRSLIIGIKADGTPTDTIEIWTPNMFMQSYEPGGTITPTQKGTYVSTGTHTSTNPLSCEINLDGRYVLQHKEQLIGLGDTNITRVTGYILQHDTQGGIKERAVFDWEWDTPGEIKRLTSFGYVECDLHKGDWLEFKLLDQSQNDIPLSQLQQFSNRWMVEYKDLIYNS